MPASVSEQEERRAGEVGLLRQLELRCRMLEIDNRVEVFRCEEYRKLVMASLGGGVDPFAEPLRLGMPALLPVPVEPERGAPERESMVLAPVGGSESSVRPSVAQPAALLQVPVPPVAVAPATTPARAARRRTVLPSSVPPSPESSRLVGAAGRGRGRGRGRGASAGPVSLRTQRRLPVVCVVLLVLVRCVCHGSLPRFIDRFSATAQCSRPYWRIPRRPRECTTRTPRTRWREGGPDTPSWSCIHVDCLSFPGDNVCRSPTLQVPFVVAG
jgi:hypothetical protein